MKLQEIARRIQSDCIGDGRIEIDGVALPQAAGPRQIAFLESGVVLAQAKALTAGAFLVGDTAFIEDSRPRLVSRTPRVAFIRLLELFTPRNPLPQGIHPSVVKGSGCRIHPSAVVMAGTVLGDRVEIGEKAVIHPLCFVGDDAKLGAQSVLHPRVTVGWGCQVGPRCILFSGVVLGADGFGHHVEEGRHYRFPHLGIVRLEEEVEVGANSTIDRAILGETLIGAATKIDNLVQIAHNSRIGRRCYIVSQTGVGGSCSIGDNVTLAGQVGVSDHVRIGDGAIALGQSGVRSDVHKGEIVGGSPALPARLINQIQQSLPRLPHLVEQLDGNGLPSSPVSQPCQSQASEGWREEVLQLLAAELQIPAERLKPETNLRQEFDADSLAVLTILSQIESRFDISIPDEAIRRLRTPGAILDYLDEVSRQDAKSAKVLSS